MAIYQAKINRLADVDNQNECTNFGTMAIDGMKAWGLKTKKDNLRSTLYYCENVNEKVTAYYSVDNLLGHGNGMTCNENYLLFACGGNNTIVRVPRGFHGDWSKKVIIHTETSVSVIASYKPFQHIIRTDYVRKESLIEFAIGTITINGSEGKMTNSNTFYAETPEGYTYAQDIYYDSVKDLLFLTFNFKDVDGHLNNNEIRVYNLSNPSRKYNNCNVYAPKDIIEIDRRSTHKKYEVESLGLDANRKIVMACNIHRREQSNEIDAFQRITNVTF